MARAEVSPCLLHTCARAARLLPEALSALSPSQKEKKKTCLGCLFFLTWPNKAQDNDKQVSKTSGTSQGDLICRPVGGWSRMVLAALS